MSLSNNDFQERTSLHILIILLLGILAYANGLHGPFTFDDKPNIVDNPAIKGLDNFIEAMHAHTDLLDAKLKPQFASRVIGYLSFALNYQFHGLAVFGYHLVNVVIHLANALLVYALVRLFPRTYRLPDLSHDDGADASVFALFVALLFVVHPLQTQAVTYVVQRFTSLATLFCLGAVLAYLRARLSDKRWVSGLLMATSVLCTLLAMKTKEFAFILPFVLALLEFTFFTGTWRQRVFFLLPFLPTFAVIPWAIISSNISSGEILGVSSLEFGSSADISRLDYFLTQLPVIVLYLRLLLFPVGQNLDYDQPVLNSITPEVFAAATLLAALLGAGFILLRLARRDSPVAVQARFCAFGIFWFFITIAAESSLIRIKDLVFEHRLYLPSVGFIIAIVSLVAMLKYHLESRTLPMARLILPCGIGIVLLLAFATHVRNYIWQDEIRLWQDTVAKSPNKPRSHNNLALAYYEQRRYDEALAENQLSLRLKADSGVHVNIGAVRLRQNLPDLALKSFSIARVLDPQYEKAHNGECNAYLLLKRYADAQQACASAIALKPDYAEAHNLLGLVLAAQGKSVEARQEHGLAVRYRSDNVIFHNNLANALYREGQLDAALAEYRTVTVLDPLYLGAHLSIARIYLDLGQFAEAARVCRAALQLKPDYREARELLDEVQRAQSMSDKS